MGAAGEHLTLFSLTRSSISEWSIWNMLLMLCSELAGLLVPREPEMLPTLPLDDPDLTLQTDDAGIFAVNGLKLLGAFRRISKCLNAVSNDFFDRALSKPALNFLGRSLWVGCWLSRFAGASLLVLTICSSILFSLTTWFTLSPLPACCLLGGGTEPLLRPVPAAAALPLDGEQDCRLGLALGASSTEDERPLGIPGLPREAEEGLSEKDVFKLAGALREKPEISDGFNDLGIMIGELRADDAEVFDAELLGVAGTGLFSIIGLGLMTVDDCLIGIELT